MSRAYTITPPGGSASHGPRPQSLQPRPGVQVVAKKAPRVGPTAYEADGERLPPPIDLGGGVDGVRHLSGATIEINPPTDNYVAGLPRHSPQGSPSPTTFDDDRCACCDGKNATSAVLVTVGRAALCDICVMQAVDAVRDALPKRRLRLAVDRLLAGDVTPEMIEAVEKLAGGKDA